MHRGLVGTLILVATLALASQAFAGSPHFVSCAVTVSGNTLTAEGKEAGLGNETQVHIVLSATAECINPGGNHPKAANKTSVTAEGDFPVMNGKALFSLEATAAFQPNCSPPMDVAFSNISVCDDAHDICCTLD